MLADATLAMQQVQAAFMLARLDEPNKTRLAIAKVHQQQRTAADQLARNDDAGPFSGTVHELTAHAVGGVVVPGETIMKIVPQAHRRLVSVRIDPSDIDQVLVGQPVTLGFIDSNGDAYPKPTARLIRSVPTS